jgi:hypothetical protein
VGNTGYSLCKELQELVKQSVAETACSAWERKKQGANAGNARELVILNQW